MSYKSLFPQIVVIRLVLARRSWHANENITNRIKMCIAVFILTNWSDGKMSDPAGSATGETGWTRLGLKAFFVWFTLQIKLSATLQQSLPDPYSVRLGNGLLPLSPALV